MVRAYLKSGLGARFTYASHIHSRQGQPTLWYPPIVQPIMKDALLLIPFSNVTLFLPLIEQLAASRIGDHAFLGRNMVFHDLVNT